MAFPATGPYNFQPQAPGEDPLRKLLIGVLFCAAFFTLLPLACKGGGNNPLSPGGPAWTPTSTSSPTSTPTLTPTPDCLDATPIATTSIDGPDLHGNDAAHIPPMDLEGYGPNGDVYLLTLSSPATLTFSLCPTDDFYRDSFLFLRSGHCWNQSGELFNDDTCDYLPEIPAAPLTAGNYYLIVAENGGDGPGPYALRVASGGTPSVVCTATPAATPQALPIGQHPACSSAYALGTLGTGGGAATGHLDDAVNTEDWYSFTTANNGPVTVILDCYDNGLSHADFEVFGFGQCPVGSSLGSATTPGTVGQFVFTAAAGSVYYVEAYDKFGSGNYRLTVQTP